MSRLCWALIENWHEKKTGVFMRAILMEGGEMPDWSTVKKEREVRRWRWRL